MKITTFLTLKELIHDLIVNKTVVLVDILRFSTTIHTAFENGARVCLPTKNAEQAISLFESIGSEEAILCGEQKGKKIEGFRFGNSPFEYKSDAVRGRTLIFTTTNGTDALINTSGAKNVFLGAFVNLTTLKEFLGKKEQIYLLCAGQNGRFALEDFLFCGALAQQMQAEEIDDATRAAIKAYNEIDDLSAALKNCDHGRYLISIGFAEDVEYAAQIDAVEVILNYKDGRIQQVAN